MKKVTVDIKQTFLVPDDWEVIKKNQVDENQTPACLRTPNGEEVNIELETVKWEQCVDGTWSGTTADDDYQLSNLDNVKGTEKITLDGKVIYDIECG